MIRDNKITLSVDCMGGDNSVDDIIGGVNQFCSENTNDTLLLHGDKKALSRALDTLTNNLNLLICKLLRR